MFAFDYSQAPVAIRPDLPDVFRHTWAWLAAPGSWWTGRERVAIAAEVRAAASCGACVERKAALSPNAVTRAHDHADGELPEAAVDAVHRIVTDPSRLSQAWLEDLLAGGEVTDGHYVELLGVVVCQLSIDTFHRALGLAPEPLPEPLPGEHSRHRPASAVPGVGWVPMIPEGRNSGAEADLYPKRAPNVLRALSLVPEGVRRMRALAVAMYVPIDQVANPTFNEGRALSRAQIELVAGRVSAVNECFYWTSAHSLLLRASGEIEGDTLDLRAVTQGEAAKSGLPSGEALTAFAEAVVAGDEASMAEARERMVSELGEAAMVDAAAVIGNFQRMVRIADGTGIPLDAPVAMISADMRAELGIDGYGGASNTEPIRGLQRLLGRGLSRMLPTVLRVMTRR